MMSMQVRGTTAWFTLRMKNIPTRFGLSKNAKMLLETLDEYKGGYIDEAELGRVVRLSNENRKAISETIRKCASMMEKKPEELKHCIVIIEMCTEILDIANRPPRLQGFPFRKLPREIRAHVLGMIIDQYGSSSMLIPTSWGLCNCTNPERAGFGEDIPSPYKEQYAMLGKALGNEFYEVLHQKRTFYFACCCTFARQLLTDRMLFDNLRSAHVHWCGPRSAQAFMVLATCPNFRKLTIKISKATTTTLNKREASLAEFFTLPYKNRRLMDSLGADELLLLRNLDEVDVQHVSSAQKEKLSEFDRQGLRAILQAKVLKRY